ncbi:MAG TPA: hypothetical protein VLS89_04500, partial [Candidatus Nanopelagicales bacterium]|nr:hypothetical protein [Candidatus Nanopelagicales bacterium]
MDPRSIWAVSAEDIRRFQGDDGRFTALVNDLIRASASKAGVDASEIRANLKTKFVDGGVDTQVRKPIPDANGWMNKRTLWQLKATAHDTISERVLTEEIEGKKARKKTSRPKPRFVVDRLEKNYAYRFCIADSIPPSKKKTWEEHLAGVIGRIRPNRYAPRVVSADDLAVWVSRFPALVIQYFRPDLAKFQSYAQWSRSATSLTETYIHLQQWGAASARIAEHLDLKKRAHEPVLIVRGLSGVGKTRLVHEIARAAAELIVYTDRERDAEDLAVSLANREDKAAILIADECSIVVSDRLNQRLQAHTDRLRVIAIDNSGKKALSSNEIWLEKMPEQALERILAENFATVPADTRARFAELSRGYPRFAADLCRNAPRVEAEGRSSRMDSVEAYLKGRLERLTDDNRLGVSCLDALEVCSLLHRVGWKRGTVAGRELEELCRLLDMKDVEGIRDAIKVINQNTGFIALAGDWCYVTPEIVSETA